MGPAPNPTLPEELLIEILLRLPVKSLIRFKSVSKSVLALLSNPSFISKHLSFSALSEHLLIHTQRSSRHVITLHLRGSGDNDSATLQVPFRERMSSSIYTSYLRIIGSCDGLLCVTLCVDGMDLYLWNPSTRVFTNLPLPHINIPQGKRRHMVFLAFGLASSVDGSGGDYKVLRFLHLRGAKKNAPSVEGVEVYSMTLGYWRVVRKAVLDFATINDSSSSVVLNGVVHWMGIRRSDCHDLVVCFDFGSDVFKEMRLPGSYSYGTTVGWLPTVLGESLGVIVFPLFEDRNKCVDIWVMKEYGVNDSWCKEVSFRLLPGVTRPIGCCRNGEVIMLNNKNKALLYNPRTRKFKTLPVGNGRNMQSIQGYLETLIPIRMTY